MKKSKVYFTDMRVNYENNMLKKFENLVKKSGMLDIDFKDKFVALKIHFGEYGNLAFIRPNYVKIIADLIKFKGGYPFLTDASTLYSGTRSDAINHINTAELNGFNSITTGCPIVIADGLKGNDFKDIIVNLKHCSSVKIGNAIMEADIIISLSHFKGHEQAGFGGILKDKPHFHINFIMNVSPNCDCWGANDMPIVPDIGILASSDPIAIDMASVDLVNDAPSISSSILSDKNLNKNKDKFKCIHGNIDWKSGLIYGEKIGLGNTKYELIK